MRKQKKTNFYQKNNQATQKNSSISFDICWRVLTFHHEIFMLEKLHEFIALFAVNCFSRTCILFLCHIQSSLCCNLILLLRTHVTWCFNFDWVAYYADFIHILKILSRIKRVWNCKWKECVAMRLESTDKRIYKHRYSVRLIAVASKSPIHITQFLDNLLRNKVIWLNLRMLNV